MEAPNTALSEANDLACVEVGQLKARILDLLEYSRQHCELNGQLRSKIATLETQLDMLKARLSKYEPASSGLRHRAGV